MKNFDLFQASLDGVKLIEASAGTGKTYTLSGLYIRYIIEKKLLPSQILVLTFTKAATFELKKRLSEQLIACKNHLNGKNPLPKEQHKGFYHLFESYKADANNLNQVELALLSFDEAAIFTINGFCQKIISDFNNECKSVVFDELIQRQAFVQDAVYDFWRLQQKKLPLIFLNSFVDIESTVFKINSLLNKSHYREIKPNIKLAEMPALQQELTQLQHQWQQTSEQLLDFLLAGKLHGATYKAANREKYLNNMNDFFEQLHHPKEVVKFCHSFITEKVKKNNTLGAIDPFFQQFEQLFSKIFYTYNPHEAPSKRSYGNNLAVSYVYSCWLYVQEQLHKLLQEQGLYEYNDQIKIVEQNIKTNPQLAQKIADQWHTIMVDEFQDTDARQLQIFSSCFLHDKHDVIFVGDPKQAIYDFRGADVFVYQQAKQKIAKHYNLATNWRSSQQMLAASNQLFDFENSFLLNWLNFKPSASKPEHQASLEDKSQEQALMVINHQNKENRLQIMAQEIKRLQHSVAIKQNNQLTNIQNKDIAILVKTNNEAKKVYECLLSQNLPASLFSDSNVYSTEIAKSIFYLIAAINFPNHSTISTCYHGLLFAQSLQQLQEMDTEKEKSIFINHQINAKKNGLVPQIQAILHENKAQQRLLQRNDGERHYTDLHHILELIQQQEEEGLCPEQIEQLLAIEIKTPTPSDDEFCKRRLESDGEKIAIMTIHKSKGLEFPIVFLPFSDSLKDDYANAKENTNLKSIVAIHDDNNQGVICWQHRQTAKTQFLAEIAAQNRRMLYVALTRAQFRTYVGLDFNQEKTEKMPIYSLMEQISDDGNEISPAQGEHKINNQPVKTPQLTLQQFNTTMSAPMHIYSFSGLNHAQQPVIHPITAPTQQTSTSTDDNQLDFNNYFNFPKGARAGTMQHEIFENIAFNAPLEDIRTQVNKQLKSYKFNLQWSHCLTKQIHLIVNKELWHKGTTLAKLKQSSAEMEFMLPVKDTNNKAISQWLTQHRQQKTDFKHEQLSGYLTGFIDLIFYHDGKYYLLDYKTNHLGDTTQDYTMPALQQAIVEHNYDLQYLLYTTALVKYLKTKQADFNYQQHFGGVIYLFTRGINPHTNAGIYHNLPEAQIITAMTEYFHDH